MVQLLRRIDSVRRAAVLLTLVLAACGEADEPAAPDDPDRPVQAPAQTSEPPAKPANPAVCERLAPRLVGMTLEDAEALTSRKRCTLRVTSRDGLDLPVTDDYSPTRINVRVERGRVREVDGLY